MVRPGTLVGSVVKMLPSSQEQRGNRKLKEARKITEENESMISQEDRTTIEDKITLAEEVKLGLDKKWGVAKFFHAQDYRRAARDAYRLAKCVSERSVSHSSGAPFTRDVNFDCITVARSLYKCHLSCKYAFPSHCQKEKWVPVVWNEACARTGSNVNSLPLHDEFVCSSMKLLGEIRAKIMPDVKNMYGFDTSQTPDTISRNARDAQALLTEMTSIYHEPDIGGRPRHPYRHPIIQQAINITWFQDKDSDGIVFSKHFSPIPIEAIALALAVIQCCIDEWTDGTRKESKWTEERYKTVYDSHISSLNALRDHSRPQGEDLISQIQRDLLKNAR
ncbi:hypothetical protein F5148DRAFT_1187393 [Russula earlei]|uniref:Uncharacterized protein n=1 Tax=Russula earlei TaxID=71964 RepID=A0ACC0UCT0_9AGAM|nr:hypothetical protein F5148DRAFT_1187393 [Russula earlei]